jgi:uncharacterized protein YndB with AHSA1/START domain
MSRGSVVRSVSIDAPASDAFDAVTRVAEMLSWLCEGALVGLREGGNWAVGFTDARGKTEATVLGKIGQLEPGRRLLVRDISYEPSLGEPLEGLTVEWSFAERDGGCVVTVRAEVPDSGPAYDEYRSAIGPEWESTLAEMKRYLEGPRERRIFVEQGLPEN